MISLPALEHAWKHVDQFVCLYAGCEASFLTSELLEQHSGVHAFTDTSRLAQNNLAIANTSYNRPGVATESQTYTSPFPSIAGASQGHVGASFEYSGLPGLVGGFPVVNKYGSNSYAPYAVTSTRAVADPSNKHKAASFEWSDPVRSFGDPFPPSRSHDFSRDSVNLMGPAAAISSNKHTAAAHWHYQDPSRHIEQPFATDAASIGNNILLTGPSNYTDGQAVAENPLPIPMSNNPLVPLNIGPPAPPRPMCTECHQTFGRQSDLERHAKIHQAGPKALQCQAAGCKYSSSCKDRFDDHVRRRHSSRGAA